jgi:4-amino-4-deoxy-L-arabinose transferase-like glycosyltransferase
MNKKILGFLVGISLISFILTALNFRIASPPCFNADEAAFSYNAYSILKTGKDEYGTFLPLRLKSFGDYKMPLFSYLSVPFIAAFGLNELGARGLNLALSLLFPLAVFFLTQELFGNKKISLVAALLSSLSLGLHIVARHAHEAYLAAFLTTTSFLFLVRFLRKQSVFHAVALGLSILFMLFSYHPGRLFAGLFFVAAGIYIMQSGKIKSRLPVLAVILTVVALFSITDIIYKPERLKSLLFFSNPGTQLKVQELKTEGGLRYIYHPLIIGLRDIAFEHLSYFSPQFLVQNGDSNDRFGYKGMGLITPVEYVFLFIGIYYAFKNKERWRYVLTFILFLSPLSASLSWATSSMTRSLFLLVPISTYAAYGFVHVLESINTPQFKYGLLIMIVGAFGFFLTLQWDFYLFHYPKRLTTIHAWQCGYKEVGEYVKKKYSRFDRFYITREIGMPYIFMLYYLNYPPEQYQQQAHLSAPDEYGFGQVEGFDKFTFEYRNPEKVPYKSMVVGSRDDVKDVSKSYPVQVVAPQGEPMFGIIEK